MSARCVGSGRAHQAGGAVGVGDPLVRARSSCRCGLRVRRRGCCMAISTRLGRCYRCPCRCFGRHAPCTVREQDVQGRQRGKGHHRLQGRARRAARGSVEHPERDLLEPRGRGIHEAAARRRAGRSLDHLMEANRSPRPGMPTVGDRDLVPSGRTMGLVMRGWTTRSARTRRSAPSRPPRRSCCGRLRFPNQLRRPPRPWRSGLSCTNIRPGPLHVGRPPSPRP